MDETRVRENKAFRKRQRYHAKKEKGKRKQEIKDICALQVYDSPGKLVNRSGCVVEDQSEHEKHSKELFPSTDINELLEEIPVPDFECGAGESDSESEGWEDESIDDFEDDGADSDGGGGGGGGGSGNVSGGEDLSGNVYKFSWGANAARSETTSSHKGSVFHEIFDDNFAKIIL